MDNLEFNELLKKLHWELKHIQYVDQGGKDMLQNIMLDIDHLLSVEGDKNSEKHLSLNTRLKFAVEEFEVTHPNITAIMKQIIDTLSNMGI